MKISTAHRSGRMTVAFAAVAALGLSACGGGAGTAEDGAGVPVGASKEEFIEALQDMQPIELTMQASSTPGDPFSANVENYAAALEEWSGGKITVDLKYGSAVAQGGDTNNAIADGRLAYGGVIATYDPSQFPATVAIGDISFLHKQSPVAGMLQGQGALVEAAFSNAEVLEEHRTAGLEPGIPLVPGVPNGLVCAEAPKALSDLNEKQARVGGAVHRAQAESLGMVPVSLAYNEIFEGLERGIIDCSVMTIVTAKFAGVIPVAPHFTISHDVGFGSAATGTAFDAVMYGELPLAARQLMWDRQDVYLKGTLEGYFALMSVGLEDIQANGGSVAEFDAQAQAALASTNDQLLEEAKDSDTLGVEGVDQVVELNDKWASIIDELGYDDLDLGYETFNDWYSSDTVDLDPFIERLWTEVMNEHRPS